MTSKGFVLSMLAAIALVPTAPFAAVLNNHYEIDLQNYRACKVDANGDRLWTCTGNDIRSASKYYLTNNTQGSISVTSAGVVKARIDGLALDNGVSFGCVYKTTFHCNLTTGTCADGPLAPNTACTTDAQCSTYACDGGPQNDKYCTTTNPDLYCRSLASVKDIATVVFGGNQMAFTYVGGVLTYKLIGDTGDAANGCTKVCTMDTDSTGKINSNALTCSVYGDGCSALDGYHLVKVLDMDGKVLAIPSVGAASTLTGFGLYDPVQYGDVCRGGSPPADCAYDQ